MPKGFRRNGYEPWDSPLMPWRSRQATVPSYIQHSFCLYLAYQYLWIKKACLLTQENTNEKAFFFQHKFRCNNWQLCVVFSLFAILSLKTLGWFPFITFYHLSNCQNYDGFKDWGQKRKSSTYQERHERKCVKGIFWEGRNVLRRVRREASSLERRRCIIARRSQPHERI